MEETGIVRFPGRLDPRAQEFRPSHAHAHVTFLAPPPPIYFPYVPPPPPPPPLPPFPFCDGGVGFPHLAYAPPVPVCLQLPPASAAPTRALVLSSLPYEVSETAVRRELEVFGEVRGVQMERVCDGIVTVHFYDLRHAQCALKEIREQHMQHQSRLRNHYGAFFAAANSVICGRDIGLPPAPLPPPARGLVAGCAVWAQFVVPASHAVPEGHNQGTIVIFNLDPEVTTGFLKETFEAFGPVKELRETPMKKHQRFVEFFDIRDAARALREMNGKEIQGRSVVIEFSRPGGHNRKYFTSAGAATIVLPVTPTSPANSYPRIKKYPPPPPPPLPPKLSGCATSSNSSSPRSFGSQNSQHSKKSGHHKANPNRNASYKSLIDSMESTLTLRGNGNGERPPRRNGKKNNVVVSGAVTVETKQQPRIRPWKGRQGKKLDTRFLISEDPLVESNCRDSRTTVMIKNIPNKYSQKLLLNMLDNHCIHCNEQIGDDGDQPLSSYDFVYLPIDFNNKCNVGYGFVNMTSPEATLRLYKAFHQQHWEVFNSRKICEVTYARVQGLEALKEHFKNSKFPCEMDHYLPVVFTPPRDGKQLTEPFAIVGQTFNTTGATTSEEETTLDGGDCSDPMDGYDGSATSSGGEDQCVVVALANGGLSDSAVFM